MSWDLNRRKLLQIGAMGSASWLLPGFSRRSSAMAAIHSDEELRSNPDYALQALIDGNKRFSGHHPSYPHQDKKRVADLAAGQHPFATVLTCADSRVPVELLFDQGVGDIFDVRVAGNIVTPGVMGSVEYAIDQLETPVLMVLGHESCGAVTAAVQNLKLPGDMSTFVDAIMPAVKESQGLEGDAIDNAVRQNVKYQIEQIKQSNLVSQRVKAGTLKVVGSRYDLDAGSVSIIA